MLDKRIYLYLSEKTMDQHFETSVVTRNTY
jgi:hypothetical protein